MTRKWFAHERLHRHARLITAAWIAYWVILTGLLHSPKLPRSPIPLDAQALIAHFAAFAVLAASCLISRQARRGAVTYRWLGIWLVILAAYGGLSEVLQPLTHRHRDVWDGATNVAGILVVMAIFRPRKRQPASP